MPLLGTLLIVPMAWGVYFAAHWLALLFATPANATAVAFLTALIYAVQAIVWMFLRAWDNRVLSK